MRHCIANVELHQVSRRPFEMDDPDTSDTTWRVRITIHCTACADPRLKKLASLGQLLERERFVGSGDAVLWVIMQSLDRRAGMQRPTVGVARLRQQVQRLPRRKPKRSSWFTDEDAKRWWIDYTLRNEERLQQFVDDLAAHLGIDNPNCQTKPPERCAQRHRPWQECPKST